MIHRPMMNILPRPKKKKKKEAEISLVWHFVCYFSLAEFESVFESTQNFPPEGFKRNRNTQTTLLLLYNTSQTKTVAEGKQCITVVQRFHNKGM